MMILLALSLYCVRRSMPTSYAPIYGLALLHVVPLVFRANVDVVSVLLPLPNDELSSPTTSVVVQCLVCSPPCSV
ncbi:hypothetical protein B0H21DRAFT_741716 [Amylocystis lapponica]|nr:hypothetical protein B0H21DRAFT_741716 [Amylocystis lapponica]